MAAASTFGMVRMNGTPVHRGYRILDISALVERIGMNGHLNVVKVGNRQRGIYRRRRRAPVLVNFQSARSGLDLFDERTMHRAVAFAQKTYVHWQPFDGLQHAFDAPTAGGDCGAVAAVGRSYAAAYQCRNAVAQGRIRLLRGNHVDMSVYTGGREDEMLAGNGVRRRSGYQIGVYAAHYVGIAGFADAGNLAVLDAYVGFHHAQNRVEHRDVGYDQIQRPLLRSHGIGQSHAVAYGFAAAVNHLVARLPQVFLYFDIQIGIAEAYLVAHGRSEQIVVLLT